VTGASTKWKRNDRDVPRHIVAAMEKATLCGVDALDFIPREAHRRKQGKRVSRLQKQVEAPAWNELQRLVQHAIPAVVGQTLTRTTSTGATQTVTVTLEAATTMTQILIGVHGLLIDHTRDAKRIEAIVPITHKTLSAWCSREGRAHIKERTLSKWLPWLQELGLVLYQPGTHTHCSLVAFPGLYAERITEARLTTQDRLQHGFGGPAAREKELSKRGRWWRPICAALLDEFHDVHARASSLAGHIVAWIKACVQAAADKAAVVVTRIAARKERDALVTAKDRLERAERDRDDAKARLSLAPPRLDVRRALRQRVSDAEVAVLEARRVLDGTEATTRETLEALAELAHESVLRDEGVARRAGEMDPMLPSESWGTRRSKNAPAAPAERFGDEPAPAALASSGKPAHAQQGRLSLSSSPSTSSTPHPQRLEEGGVERRVAALTQKQATRPPEMAPEQRSGPEPPSSSFSGVAAMFAAVDRAKPLTPAELRAKAKPS